MKKYTLPLFFLVFGSSEGVFGQSICVDWFPFHKNFENVVIRHNNIIIKDAYELCVGEKQDQTHTLVILRPNSEAIEIEYHEIQSIDCWFWYDKVEIKTTSGFIRFTTIDVSVRGKLQPYFKGKEIKLRLFESPPW